MNINALLDRTPTEAAINSAAQSRCAFLMLGHGRFTLLDFEDWELLNGFRWHFNQRGYAARLQYVNGRRSDKIVYLHRIIMGDVPGRKYDHFNRDKLDNRRCNLRVATVRQNAGNVGKRHQRRPATSTFKGVSFDSSKQRWLAQGRDAEKHVFLGRFKDEADAARAYNVWASSHFGEFAFLNPV